MEKGITLIAFVITIIILLVLAGISIATLAGDNGIITKAMESIEQTKINDYKEQIEVTITELQVTDEDYTPPTLHQIKEVLDKKSWVESIEYVIDNETEKLKLTTKEGYIFYITQTEVEYKGKGEERDTSALEREDVLKMEAIQTTLNGQLVQITDLTGVDYYKIKYQIGSTEGEWQDIKSAETVEVPYGGKIYAKLVYGSNDGIIYSLDISHTEPIVIAKNTNMNNIVRKVEIPFADLFDITWGSDGTGTVQYEVTGNLVYNNTPFSSQQITSLAKLEVGTYNVKCTITSPKTKKTVIATKQDIKIATLASTTIKNNSNANATASAIYSEYDLAYFRDLVNDGKYNINAKIMNDLNLTKVSDWTPIGAIKGDISFTSININKRTFIGYYSGIFDGNLKNIVNLTINNPSATTSLGLFGAINGGTVKNCIIKEANINGNRVVGTIAGYAEYGYISNCKSSGSIQGTYGTGGLIGFANDETRIYASKNEVNVTMKRWKQ